ncbi:MAG: hypothetical protein P1U34_01055 [Coxiellaceae bacterium]|nr:hypothetical protein [Coxiellaceae bacterium]
MQYAEILDKKNEDMLGDKEGAFLYLRKKQAISSLTYGTKFHLSVRADQVEDAWNCIEDLLISDDSPFDTLKVIDTSESDSSESDSSIEDDKEKLRMLRITQGMQFTLYVHGHISKPEITEAKLTKIAALLQAIETRLSAAGIEPGIIPESDHRLSRYASARYALNGSLYVEGLDSKGEHNWRAARAIEYIARQNSWPIEALPAYDPALPPSFHHLLDWHETLIQETTGWLSDPTRNQSLLAQDRWVIDTIFNASDLGITDFEKMATLECVSRTALKYEHYSTRNAHEQMVYNLIFSDHTIESDLKNATNAIKPYLSQMAELYSTELVKQHMQLAFPEDGTQKYLWDAQFREKLFFPPYLYYYIECSTKTELDDLSQQFFDNCSEESFAIDVIRVSLKTGLDPMLAQLLQKTPVIKKAIYERETELYSAEEADKLKEIMLTQVADKKAGAALRMTQETTELMGPGHPF